MIEKFKKIAAFISAAVMTATFLYLPIDTFKGINWGISANAGYNTIRPIEPYAGDGTEENPYEISIAEQLYWFAEQVNSGNKEINAVLVDDITVNKNLLSSLEFDSDGYVENGFYFTAWTPIGIISSSNPDDITYNPYNGKFDGQNHTISGLYFNYRDNGDNIDINSVGLFGTISNGTVSNVCVADSYFEGSWYTGGVCGSNGGTIKNCYNTGTISGDLAGGVCGDNSRGTIENSYNTGTVSGGDAGGVCSYNAGTIKNCYNIGTVSGNSAGGGVCRANEGTVENCYNTGTVSGNNVGGVCQYNGGGTIKNCYNTGKVSGNYTGGVCVEINNTITNCYYLENTASGGIGNNDNAGSAEVKTAEQFASGEVAMLLGDAFGQTIGTDEIPVLGGPKVYYVKEYSDCGKINEVGSVYSNSEEDVAPAHDYSNGGICTVCNELENGKDGFKSASVSLTDGVIVNYNVILSDKAIEDENAYIKFTAESGINKNIKFSEAVLTGETYKFSLELRPDQMSEIITAQVIYGDGTEGNSVDFSIKEYSEKLTNEIDKKLADSMKLYGAFAQIYTGRKTDNLISDIKDYETNATIGEEYNYSLTENASGIKTKSATLQIGSQVTILVKYQLEEGKNISDYTFMCGDKSLKPVKSGDYYCVYLRNILPQDLDEMYEIVVKDKGNAGNETTLKYSAFSYMKSAFEKSDSEKKLTNLLNAMYDYNKAAEEKISRR